MSAQKWKCGNEFLPYHHQASHVNPDHRDGWNACYRAAQSALQAQAEDHAAEIRRIRDIRNENSEEYRTEIRLCREEIAALKEDAERYRWLREQSHPWGSRWLSREPLDTAIDSSRAAGDGEGKR